MSSIEDIIARVEAATGPDEGLDRPIYQAAFFPDTLGNAGLEAALAVNLDYRPPPKYTASLDAIVGLIEQEMPKSRWEVGHYWIMKLDAWGSTAHVDCPVAVESHYKTQPFNPISTARTAPLALCAAFLRAYVAARPKP